MPRWCHPLMSGSLVAIILAAGLVAQTALRAQETRSSTRLTTEHYLDWERVSDAQISPDGTRLVYTLLLELGKRGKRWGVASACIGGGQGIAMVLERV